ncbi:MAG: ParA family protein [Paludibacteraceae bacterium]|nr:ParA family protein [Paludibacteraceae bacterium]MBR2261701.1 ParA family protein [Paludibacteraceae bacterium]MEE3483446.1 ParA family protein [Bacteroidales bacterium]
MALKTRIISFSNHKGGVGKTTTTASVGTILASKKHNVLLIDLDAQANLTASLYDGEVENSIYTALIGKSELPIIKLNKYLDLVPASLQLAMADLELASVMAREKILSELLEKVADKYEYILIDCPPSLGLLTLNALTASTDIIIPMVAEILPFKGLTMINDFVSMVQQRLNPNAHVSGIIITRWETTNLSKTIEEKLRENLGDIVFKTKIRKNVSLAEAPLENKNIAEYAPKSSGAEDYRALVNELIKKLKKE